MYNDITAVILAGGKSTRMGTNKALLPYKNTTIIEAMLAVLSQRFSKIVISTNAPETYLHLQHATFPDLITCPTPLAGVHAALTHSQTNMNFIVSCDFPLVCVELIDCMITKHAALPVTVCYGGGFLQHLIGIYERRILSNLESYLFDLQNQTVPNAASGCRVKAFIESVGYTVIDTTKETFYHENLFLNINRPDDYQKLIDL